MIDWKIKVDQGTRESLDEEAFISETLVMFRRLQADWNNKITLLKDEHFGLNIPKSIRRAMNLPEELVNRGR